MKDIRVASVQFEHIPNDKQANMATIERFALDAAQQGVEILVFPECCITGYWHLRKLSREALLALAEPVPAGPTSQALLALARQHKMTIGAGLVEVADDGTLYNTYVVAMPDGQSQRHRKLHCFISEHMASGSEYTVFDTPHASSPPTRPAAATHLTPTRWAWSTALCGRIAILTPKPSRPSCADPKGEPG
jgi:predicted amidohydrolase